MSNEYRISRRDRHNWTVEQYRPGGEVIARGKFAGQVSTEGWHDIAYYPTLRDAARRLLDQCVGDTWTGADLAAALDAAEARVLATIAAAGTDIPAPPAVANPATDLTAEQRDAIRAATDPVKVYLATVGGKRFKRTSDETRRGLSPAQAVLERVAE